MTTSNLFSTAALTLLLCSLPCPAQGQKDLGVVKTFSVGGQGSWDYLTLEPQTHRLFVPRSTHTMVIDTESGKTLADIPGQKTAHGVAIVPEAGRGFISDGGGNGAILIFDLKTYAVLGSLTAQPDSDGIIFDRASGRVLAVSGDKGVLMSFRPDIDPKSGKLDATIDLGGAPEFLAADGSGNVFINLMDKNEVAVVDLKTRKVTARWPVAPGGAPVGLAIDPQQHRLFIGCRKPAKLIVMSTETGKVLADMPIGESVDAVKLVDGRVFASTAGAQLYVAGETAPGKFSIVQTVKTGDGARTMDVDHATHTIYLPSADFETGGKGRATPKPGTFRILVVAEGRSQ